MKAFQRILGLSVLAVGAQAALAQQDIRLGEPAYGGNGCPIGTASVTLSPDQKSLSVLFDQYIAEAGASVGKTLDRKSCNLAIPVHVPQGLSVSILAVDYRGFNSLPARAQSTFNVEYFFAGQRGPAFQRTFMGPLESDYLIRNNLIATAQVWSACGQDVILRTNTSITARTNPSRQDTLATVDSQDVSAALIYSLQWKRCR